MYLGQTYNYKIVACIANNILKWTYGPFKFYQLGWIKLPNFLKWVDKNLPIYPIAIYIHSYISHSWNLLIDKNTIN